MGEGSWRKVAGARERGTCDTLGPPALCVGERPGGSEDQG